MTNPPPRPPVAEEGTAQPIPVLSLFESQPKPVHGNEEADNKPEEEQDEERIQTIVFVRHGVAQHNFSGADLTSPTLYDPALVQQGKVGAVQAGQQIQMWFSSAFSSPQQQQRQRQPPPIELVISSPLTRCLQTAVLAFGVPGDYYSNNDDGGRGGDDDDETTTTTTMNDNDSSHAGGDESSGRPTDDPIPYSDTTVHPQDRIRITCVEHVREAAGIHYPDKRRPLSQLKRHWGHLVQFDQHMTERDELWSRDTRESLTQLEARIQQFLQRLCQRSETNIVVVSHGVWMETLFHRHAPEVLWEKQNHHPRNHNVGNLGPDRPMMKRVYNCNAFRTECVSTTCRNKQQNHRQHHHLHPSGEEEEQGGTVRFVRLQNTHLL